MGKRAEPRDLYGGCTKCWWGTVFTGASLGHVYALKYVKEPSPKICMAAVQQYGRLLKYDSEDDW